MGLRIPGTSSPAGGPGAFRPSRRRWALAALVLPAGGGAEPLGTILATFDAPCSRPAGLGWNAGKLWLVCDSSTPTIYQLDPTTMSVLNSFAAPTAVWAFGLDHDGTKLWGDTDEPRQIYCASDSDLENGCSDRGVSAPPRAPSSDAPLVGEPVFLFIGGYRPEHHGTFSLEISAN